MYCIQKVYTQTAPAMRFIGKLYGDEDRADGNFSHKWGEAFAENGWLSVVEALSDKQLLEDNDAYIGLMRVKDGEPFVYGIGMFCAPETPVPSGLDFVDFPASVLGIGWVYGGEGDVYCKEIEVSQQLAEKGFSPASDSNGALWCFERYVCPRFTTPDKDGNVILDIGFFVTK